MARGRAGGNSLQRSVCAWAGHCRAQQVPHGPSPALQMAEARGQPEPASRFAPRGMRYTAQAMIRKRGRGTAGREVIFLCCSLGRDQLTQLAGDLGYFLSVWEVTELGMGLPWY